MLLHVECVSYAGQQFVKWIPWAGGGGLGVLVMYGASVVVGVCCVMYNLRLS